MYSLSPPADEDYHNATIETTASYTNKATDYAKATGTYDSFPGIRDEVIAFSDVALAGHPVLDLGCGAGRDGALLAHRGRFVIAGDICKAMLDTFASRDDVASGSTARVCLDICDLPIGSGVLGGVWASGSLLHLPSMDLPRGLGEIFRVLRSGGIASVSMQIGSAEGWRFGGTLPGRRWFTLVDPESFASLMRNTGFRQVGYRYVGRPGWFLVSGRKSR